MEIKKDPNVEALDRNIATIHNMRQKSDQIRSWHQKMADGVAAFLGSPLNLYAHLAIYLLVPLVIIYQSLTGVSDWQSPLSALGTLASAEAVFFTIFVLMNQRHMNHIERRNSDLHLQMSLLSEHEITRLIRLNDQIARHLGIPVSESGKDLEELKKDINPDLIVKKIFEHESKTPTDSTTGPT